MCGYWISCRRKCSKLSDIHRRFACDPRKRNSRCRFRPSFGYRGLKVLKSETPSSLIGIEVGRVERSLSWCEQKFDDLVQASRRIERSEIAVALGTSKERVQHSGTWISKKPKNFIWTAFLSAGLSVGKTWSPWNAVMLTKKIVRKQRLYDLLYACF